MRPSVVLALAVLGISFAGPLIRLSSSAPLVIASWRLGFSLLFVGAMLLATGTWRQWRGLTAREGGVAAGAGVLLALHFWSWNASLGLTSVAASVVLVNLQPVFVAVGSALWLGERPATRQALGMGVAVLGALVVALPDLLGGLGPGGSSGRALLGDALALAGAVAAALYYLAGRRLRQRYDVWAYVGLVYGACFVTLVLLCLATGARLAPQPSRELAIFLALAAGPMILGHTGMNWALRYLPAYVVNLTVLGEPVGATLLAAVMPGIREVPSATTLAGGALILAGVVAASRPPR